MDGLGLNPPRGVHPVRRVGLTGGIGSGKSTVARYLVDAGALLVDTDAIARALTLPGGAALPALATEFGAGIIGPDGAMDRERMRALAFSEPEAKRRLERILHPMIGQMALQQADAGAGQVVVFDVPLLGESSPWRQRVDRLLVVDCSDDTQVARVMRRSGWSEDAVRRVIAHQTPRAARRAIGDAVIVNEGLSLAQLAAQVRALWALWNNQPH